MRQTVLMWFAALLRLATSMYSGCHFDARLLLCLHRSTEKVADRLRYFSGPKGCLATNS